MQESQAKSSAECQAQLSTPFLALTSALTNRDSATDRTPDGMHKHINRRVHSRIPEGIHGHARDGIHDLVHDVIHCHIHDSIHSGIHDSVHESIHGGVHDRIHEKPPAFLDRMPDVPTKLVL